jgi:hypothetical protein
MGAGVTAAVVRSFPCAELEDTDSKERNSIVRSMTRSAAAALAVLALGCGGKSTEPEVDANVTLLSAPTEIELRFGQEVQVGGSVLKVSFANVAEDSRCPADVVCVWQGNAGVEIGVRMGMGPTYPLRLNTTVEPRDARWQDLRFTLLEVRPYPRTDTPRKLEDYSIKLRITPGG